MGSKELQLLPPPKSLRAGNIARLKAVQRVRVGQLRDHYNESYQKRGDHAYEDEQIPNYFDDRRQHCGLQKVPRYM